MQLARMRAPRARELVPSLRLKQWMRLHRALKPAPATTLRASRCNLANHADPQSTLIRRHP
eukprot:5219100-Pleurochrysis_carterae.AAC.1